MSSSRLLGKLPRPRRTAPRWAASSLARPARSSTTSCHTAPTLGSPRPRRKVTRCMLLAHRRRAAPLGQGLAALAGDVLELARQPEAHILLDDMDLAHRDPAGLLEGLDDLGDEELRGGRSEEHTSELQSQSN